MNSVRLFVWMAALIGVSFLAACSEEKKKSDPSKRLAWEKQVIKGWLIGNHPEAQDLVSLQLAKLKWSAEVQETVAAAVGDEFWVRIDRHELNDVTQNVHSDSRFTLYIHSFSIEGGCIRMELGCDQELASTLMNVESGRGFVLVFSPHSGRVIEDEDGRGVLLLGTLKDLFVLNERTASEEEAKDSVNRRKGENDRQYAARKSREKDEWLEQYRRDHPPSAEEVARQKRQADIELRWMLSDEKKQWDEDGKKIEQRRQEQAQKAANRQTETNGKTSGR